MDIQDIKIGQKVYYRETWTDIVRFGKVVDIKKENNNDIIIVKTAHFGTLEIRAKSVFETKKQCENFYEEQSNEQIKKYKEQMKTIEDCLIFAYKNNISRCEEYTNWEAREAYEQRVFELTNINLKNFKGE